MRRLVSVLTILLLATAAAAGAGDDIKWKRSKDLTFVVPGGEATTSCEFNELARKYTLSWENYRADEVYAVEATYIGWDVVYTVLSISLAGGIIDEDEFNNELENERERFRNNIIFTVSVLADSDKHARLSNRLYWEVYLADGGKKIPAAEIEFSESAFEEALLRALYEAGLGGLIIRSKKKYVVTFAKPYAGSVPTSLKLVVLCDDCRRGFEWRFKQD